MKRLALLLALLCSAGPAQAAPTFVANNAGVHTSTAHSVALTTTGSCAIGSTSIVIINIGGVVTGFGVVDAGSGGSNTYATAGSALVYNSSGNVQYVSSAPVTNTLAAGASAITISWTGDAVSNAWAGCASGLASSSYTDVTGQVGGGGNGVTGTGSSVSGLSSGALAQASELLVSVANPIVFGPSCVADVAHGWTNLSTGSGSYEICIDYEVVSATTSVADAASWGSSGAYGAGIWSFKAPAAAASGPPPGSAGLMGVGR